jgi:hypothetical protein
MAALTVMALSQNVWANQVSLIVSVTDSNRNSVEGVDVNGFTGLLNHASGYTMLVSSEVGTLPLAGFYQVGFELPGQLILPSAGILALALNNFGNDYGQTLVRVTL